MHLAVTALLPLSLLPMAAAPSIAVMALIVIPAGLFIAPLLATRNELVGYVAPPGALTEAYTWPVTAFVGGISIGAAMAGQLVEGPGLAGRVPGRRGDRSDRRHTRASTTEDARPAVP